MKFIKKNQKTQNTTAPWEFPSNDAYVSDNKHVTSGRFTAQCTILRCCYLFWSGARAVGSVGNVLTLMWVVYCSSFTVGMIA